MRPGSGGDHGGVVGAKGKGGEGDGEPAAGGLGGEAAAEFGVGGDAAGDEDGAGACAFRGGEGLLEEAADDRVLEAADEVEEVLREVALGAERRDEFWGGAGGVGDVLATSLRGGKEVVGLEMAEDGCLDAGEGEVEGACRMGGDFVLWAHLLGRARPDRREAEGDGARVAQGSEGVDPGAAWVGKTEKLRDLVEGFAGGVVHGAAEGLVGESVRVGEAVGAVEVRVAAGDDESDEGCGGGGGGSFPGGK